MRHWTGYQNIWKGTGNRDKMYKMIAIDLDGTLLNSEKKISAQNKTALRHAMEKGVKIVICSGRIYAFAGKYAREVGSKEPVITCNGAVIRSTDTGEVLFSRPLSTTDCLKVIELCHEEDIYFHFYTDDTMYAEKLERSALNIWKRNMELPEEERINLQITDDAGKILKSSDKPPIKLVAISDDAGKLSRVREKAERIGSVDVTSSGSNNFEVVAKGINKGMALEFLSGKLGINRNEIIAIGDNENDAPMLRYAGMAVAMGNADKAIKDMADFVTLTNDEDGVAEAIKKLIP